MSDRFLNIHEVCKMVGLGKTKIYDLINKHQFPPPIKSPLLGRSVRWQESEVITWMQAVASGADWHSKRKDRSS